MASTKVEVEIVAVLKEAKKAVDDFAKTTQKQLDGLNLKTTISALSDGFNLIQNTAGRALSSVSGFLKDAVNEALEAEKAQVQLANAIRLTGDFTATAVKEFNDFADALTKTTTLTDDQIINAAALAKTFRLTNDEARLVVKAATDLSAATGDDLNTSVEKLAKTFNGFVDKSLKQLAPELKNLTQEQLAAGEAARIFQKRFDGSAAALRNTAGGGLKSLTNALSDFSEEIGNAIIQNEVFSKSVTALTNLLIGLTERIKGVGTATRGAFEFGKEFRTSTAEADLLKKNFDALTASTKDFGEELKRNQRIAQGQKISAESDKALADRVKGERILNNAREKALEEFNSIRNAIEAAGLSDVEKINKDAAEKIKVIRAAINTGAIKSTQQIQGIIAGIETDRVLKVAEIEKKKIEEIAALQKKAFEEQRANVEKLAKNPFGGLFPEGSRALPAKDQNSVAQGAGVLNSILGGAQGAEQIFKSLAGQFANALVPGLGPVVEQIVGVLAKGPEEVRKLVREFAAAIPSLIENIILAVPVLVEEIAKAVPLLVQRLVEAIPTITNELVKALPTVAAALAAQMPAVAVALVSGIVSNIPKIVEGFAREFLKIPERFVDALLDAIPGGSLFGGGDGGGVGGFVGDIFGGIGDIFGFAEGGRVPDKVSFRGDGFPARLDAGEQVLSRDLTNRLEAFLDGGSSGGSQTVILQVGQQELARAIFELNRGGFRTA